MGLTLQGDEALVEVGSEVVMVAFVVSTVVIGSVVVVVVVVAEIEAEAVAEAALFGSRMEGNKEVLVIKMGGR